MFAFEVYIILYITLWLLQHMKIRYIQKISKIMCFYYYLYLLV